jgi:hypothetical protein
MTIEGDARRFIPEVVLECIQNKVSLQLLVTGEAGVDMDGVICSGYFDSEAPELVLEVGGDIDIWFPVMLHEYCHMRQWIERKEWFEGADADSELTEWLSGKVELSPEEIDRYVRVTMELEGECEGRVIELIKKWGMSIDVQEYGQKAMSYVHMYRLIGQLRQWSIPGKAPYKVEEVWRLFPSTIDLDWKPGEEHIQAYMKHCFAEKI